MNEAIRDAITSLVQKRNVDLGACAGPIYFMMYGVRSEDRARELAAAVHAALYADLGPLTRAVPPAP
ncbi:hypothetical protein [Streptomyces sp. NPDC001851]|uniref:hypothetical protein n=1 Tax=Streptomyces sp. NPDC001851 TaxID=3154529 RepID=UPI00332C718B